jgi:tRNA A-37 threonylcarbamoyl transferase component Bud32
MAMAPKPASLALLPDSVPPTPADVALCPRPASPVEGWVRRVAGEGLVNLFRARSEVLGTLHSSYGEMPAVRPLDDALQPSAIPSLAAGCHDDRVLAEVDQDGFAFAVSPIDVPFFDRRAHRTPRQQNLVDIALVDGVVCVRKRYRGLRLGARRWGTQRVPWRERVQRSVWAALGMYLYSEAAALLRLHDLPFVPKLRRIDFADRALYMDYVPGESLRAVAAHGGEVVHDADLKAVHLRGLSAHDLERREVALLDRASIGDFRREIAGMVREMNARGVAPLDIKLGNFIRGATTGRLYWIDFEISRLSSQPRWEADLALERDILERLFAITV